MPDPESPNPSLVVEADSPTRMLLVRQLEAARYTVVACNDGLEALEALRAITSGIVLADWLMPNMDGVELCRHLRARFPDLPILILTAYVTERERVMAAGASDFLPKPVTIRDLRSRVRVLARLP